MKIRELTKFDKTLKMEFCNYLKKYFKEDCKVTWLFDVDCKQINILTLAKELEEIIK